MILNALNIDLRIEEDAIARLVEFYQIINFNSVPEKQWALQRTILFLYLYAQRAIPQSYLVAPMPGKICRYSYVGTQRKFD